ncbi:non-ribosomal peptide synthetase, partial [Staphylococcus sp. HMSC62A08]|uniref:non-ribosomal peptide synthetase n=1 Tax=Staphylococcus sp. HMSC62A08 TaxID=1608883 RepID=UPI00210AD79C
MLNVKQVESVFNRNKTINIINGYGPTENTIISTFYEISKDFTEREIIPIGKPVSNTNVFLMDFNDKLVPKGFVGEIYLSGDGLAKGYVNNEKEMKKRFIENPYNPKERLYKTGDLAKWNNDGDLVYIGRKDNQVKLRGYRVELSEIENQIQLLPGVKEVVVMLLDNHTLASYYSTYNSIVTEKFIKKSLKKVLPEFMIPVYFIHLNELPLSPNGKIDKKTLPLPIIDKKTNDIKNAQNQVQEIMLDTWKEVFMMEELGVTTNFFEIGGDSIKAIQIVSRLRNKDLVLKVNDILKYKNIEKLEKYTVNICDKKIIK